MCAGGISNSVENYNFNITTFYTNKKVILILKKLTLSTTKHALILETGMVGGKYEGNIED